MERDVGRKTEGMKKTNIARNAMALLVVLGAEQTVIAVDNTTQPCAVADNSAREMLKEMLASQSGEWLSYGFLLEAEGVYVESEGKRQSDMVLASAELAVNGQLSTNVSFHLCLLWEEDDAEENLLDEAYLTLGGSDELPVYLQAGKMYLPFGNFNSIFISDPLTLELGEINKSAVHVGYALSMMNVSASVFKGEEKEAIQDGVVALTLTPHESIAAGAFWLSDLMETDGLVELGETLATNGYERVSGVGAFVTLMVGSATLHTEWMGAIESIDIGGKYRPMALHVEASTTIGERWSVGLRYEKSDDFYASHDGASFGDAFADEQVAAVICCKLTENLSASCEYLHAENDDGKNCEIVSFQLAVSF